MLLIVDTIEIFYFGSEPRIFFSSSKTTLIHICQCLNPIIMILIHTSTYVGFSIMQWTLRTKCCGAQSFSFRRKVLSYTVQSTHGL